MKRELDHLCPFLTAARGLRQNQSGSRAQFLIEPKPMEPTKHQYDFDCATGIGFFEATVCWNGTSSSTSRSTTPRLPSHTFNHELEVAADAGLLGCDRRQRAETTKTAGTPTSSPTTLASVTLKPWSSYSTTADLKPGGSTSTQGAPQQHRPEDLFHATSAAWTPLPAHCLPPTTY